MRHDEEEDIDERQDLEDLDVEGSRPRTRTSTRTTTTRPATTLSADQKAGSSSVPYPRTVTLKVSSRSSVAGRSRIAFAPEQTRVIGVRPSSARSADSSNRVPPGWTPPMPPVAATSTPSRWARNSVAATVDPPLSPRVIASGRSRVESLRADCARSSRAPSSIPTAGFPSNTPTNAGSAPASRTAFAMDAAADSRTSSGRPVVRNAVSSATRGRTPRRSTLKCASRRRPSRSSSRRSSSSRSASPSVAFPRARRAIPGR